jgi:hypothetical protein
MTAWQEGGFVVVLLRGQVLAQQGVVQARFDQGVAWVDQERLKRTGLCHVQVYAEGRVRLDSSSDVKDGAQAVLDLTTRGELHLHSQFSKMRREVRADDPVVQSGRAERLAPKDSGVTPASAPGPPPAGPAASPPGPGKRVSYSEPLPPSAVPPGAPVPGYSSAPGPPAVPTPGPAPPAGPPAAGAPAGGAPAPAAPPRPFSVVPRRGGGFDIRPGGRLPSGEQSIIVTGGLILRVEGAPGVGLLDVEADQAVIWTKGDSSRLLNTLQSSQSQSGQDLEFYLKGNVELRSQDRRETQTLRADELYYDVNRNVAVALSATLELRENPVPGKAPIITEPVYARADELQRLSATQYRVIRSDIFSSKLPSDPGLKVYVSEAVIEDKEVPRRTIFGREVVDRQTGQPLAEHETLIRAENVFFELESVPFFYLPYLAGDARHPLGPVEEVTFSYNRIFGFQSGVVLDVYQLLGLQPVPDTRWRMHVDYLTRRGPMLGTDFDYSAHEFFGLPARREGFVVADGVYDRATDILGGPRPVNNFDPPNGRGRLEWRDGVYNLPEGFQFQTQAYLWSDRNFLEEYFKREFDTEVNMQTFVYLKQQQGNWAWTGLVEDRPLWWMTWTESLPRFDGYLLGASLFDRLTSDTWASVGYYRLRTSNNPELPLTATDRNDDTGRFNLMEELALPLYLGPFKVVPYVKGALTEYTHDLDGESTGRAWGGGGVRASLPLTRVFPDVDSELWNLHGIAHKITLAGNYFYAGSTEPYTRFPQLDRLTDHAAYQSVQDMRTDELQGILYPGGLGTQLATSPVYDPQLYAIRKLVDNRIDTLNAIEVLQLDLRQRLQTKRGYPGAEHIIDWMVLDLSVSYFPAANRDNFGDHWAFLEYDYVWNVGDRTALTSTGWVDPESGGPRVFTVGVFFNRPDRTNFYVGYRQIDPLQSRAVSASVTYIFSPKYAVTASAVYDFGINESLSNSLVLTRIGTDLSVSLGITYNALTSSVGAVFEIVPNLVPANRRFGGIGSGTFAGR